MNIHRLGNIKQLPLQQQASNPQQMEQQKPLQTLTEAIKGHLEQLNKINEEVVRKLSHPQYPMKGIIGFYQKDLLPRLTARMGKSYVFSDIVILYGHRLVGFVYAIEDYVSKLDAKAKKQIVQMASNSPSTIQKSHTLPIIPLSTPPLVPQSSQNSLTDIPSSQYSSESNQNSLQSTLKVPQVFIMKTLPILIRNAIKYCENMGYLGQVESLGIFLGVLEASFKLQDWGKEEKCSQEEIQQKIKMAFYKDVPYPNSKRVVKFGYRFLFIAKLRQRVKKANKRINERKSRLLELIDGQRKYIEGLKDYIEYIKKPIEANGLATKDEQKIMFSTIEPILTLHTHFHQQLSQHFAKYDKNQTYGDILAKNFPYFKIYTDYIYYADQAQALILKLAEQHPQIEEICSKFMREKEKKASDELKQPTFRIARYEMILKEIIKNTNPIHRDYDKLVEAQKVGVSMLRKINENVDATCRRNRLNQLEQEYGTEERPIYAQKREFLEEFQLFYIHEDKFEPVNVLVFNDIVIIIQNQLRKIIKWIKIDQNFYVRKEEDNKTYKNVIKLHSEGFITLSAGSEEKHFNKAENFFNLLQRVSKENEENNRMVYVQVIGTQEIGSTSFAKHTQYVIEIKYIGFRKLVHLRFSQMQPLVKTVQLHYENDLNISQQEALKKNWFNNHKSKTIEDRKRTIEQILQKMLNHELVKKDPAFILEELKIDGNFFHKAEQCNMRKSTKNISEQSKIMEKSQSKLGMMAEHSDSIVDLSTMKLPLKSSFLTQKSKKKQSKEAETILCATEIKLGRDVFHDPDDAFFDPKKTEAEKFQIPIYTMVEDEPCIVSITEFYTVEDVCHKMSKIIGLRMNRDFRLFHEIGKKELRVLDQEQKLAKIFNFPKNQVKIGFVSQIFGSIKKIVNPETHPKLVFKKYYFLPVEIQQSECRKDLTRLRLVVYQIFYSIKQMKYQLSFDEYLLFLAMLIYIESDGQPKQKISESYVDKLIPETIFKLKNYTEQQWIEKCRPHFTRLSEQINKIIDYNREQLKLKKIKVDSISKTALYFGHSHLCSQIVINKIKSNVIFGANLFYVQPYKKTFEKLSGQGIKMAYNMWLAIKVQSLNLLTPSSKQTVFQLKYKDIQKIFVYSQSITFKIQGLSTCEYRFNTYQSFQISQLVKYNKCLNDTLLELERNEDLILKARMYKQESLIYRNTYDKTERDREKDPVEEVAG